MAETMAAVELLGTCFVSVKIREEVPEIVAVVEILVACVSVVLDKVMV